MPETSGIRQDLEELLAKTLPIWQELDSAQIFVTGATGFFGAWLIESAIFAIDQLGLKTKLAVLSRRVHSGTSNIAHLTSHPSLTWVQGDLLNFGFPDGEWTHVLHAGAEASSSAHQFDPYGTFLANMEGTKRCLEFVRIAKAHRFLYVSSGAVYGPLTSLQAPVTEDYPGAPNPLDKFTAYAQGKRAGEFLCATLSDAYGFEASIARCFAFVGPYQPARSSFAISSFIADVLEGKKIRVSGDGTPIRSYLYAADLAEHLWTMLVKAPNGQAFNIGSEEPISIAELGLKVNEVLSGKGVEILETRDPAKPVQSYLPSTAKARELLGLQAETSLEAAILKTAAWFRSYGALTVRE